jgi:hypothetical protein
MSQIVKLRRSSVSGQKPTNSNLQLGELALNTTDGKVYMAKSGSLGPSVEELITTNTVNTGSLSIIGAITGSIFTGSFVGDGSQLTNIPLSGVTNLVTISGSIDNRLDILEAYSGSQLVPSASMSFRTLQTDVFCKNMTGAQINKGTVVRIVGSIGDNPLIGVANLMTEGESANTLGFATENIPNDSFGLIITEGTLIGVNTNGMTAGALLYLGVNGTFTTTPPVAPNHGVRLGEVLRVQQNNGSIYVRVDNGIELNEAHDVIYTGITHGDLLVRSGSLWKNSKSLEGNYIVTGSLTVTQNLTVLGSSSLVYVTSSNLAVSASFISVNVFEPAERFGGLKVYDSGSSNATASLAWDSQNNHWIYQNASGSSYSGGMLLAGPRNSGSLGQEVGLINGRIAKSVGGDHLDNSIISETGTTINIDGNLVANSITGSFDFFGLINKPTLVSGSPQIDITGTTGYSTFSGSISSSIGSLSSSVATTTLNIVNDFNSFTSSYTTGSFTGSFKGDGTELYNIPASGVTGLDKIVSGPYSASISSTRGFEVNVGSTFEDNMLIRHSGSINMLTLIGNHESYTQLNLMNMNSGSSASGDIVVTSNSGDESVHYINMGINSSTYDAGYVGGANDSYLLNSGEDLYIGTIGGGIHSSDLHLFTQNNWENPQIHISGSKQIGFNTSSVSDGFQYEFSGSIKGKNNLTIVGSVSSSMFTGSFKGDGSQLYNIPASGVTGLSLDKIVNGNASASIDNNGFYVNRDVYIDGTITAKEIHTDYVTSSVLFQSGSTKFGNTNDDTHQFTGSLHVNDEATDFSIVGNGFGQTSLISPNGALVLTPGIYGVQINGAFPDLKVNGNIVSDGYISSSTNFRGDGSGLYNLPYSGLTNVPTLISGSSQISYTGITDTPNGVVSGSSQIIDLGFTTTSSLNSFTSSYVIDSSSFDSRINVITGSLNGLTSTFNSYTSSMDTFTSSVLLSYQTSSMTVLSSSYAVTASYALNGGGGGTEGRTAKLVQSVVSDTWTFAHNLGEKYPSVEIFDENDYVIIPTNILAVDENNLTITFSHEITGVATATVGGGLPYISGSYNGRVLAVGAGNPVWKEGIISGSLQVSNFGFAITGSNSFKDNQIITGSVTIRNAKMDATCVTLTTNATVFNLGSYDGAIFDYVVKNGGNMRAGTITGVWNGSTSNYNETSTVDMGTTSNINFNVTGTGLLNAVITGGTWQVEVFYRALGCSS